MQRRLFVISLAAAIGLLLAACGSPSAPAAAGSVPTGASPSSGAHPTVTVAASAVAAGTLPTFIAKEKGFLEQNGLNANMVSIAGGTATDALIAGQLQFLQISTKVIQADLSGADLEYIGASMNRDRFWLYGAPSFTDVAGLKGKKVGVTGIGTATHTAAKLMLASFGLDPAKDVTIVALGDGPNTIAALQSHAADVGVLTVPDVFAAQKAGLPMLFDSNNLGKGVMNGWYATSRKYAQQHPDIVIAYLKSMTQAVAFELQHPDEAQQLLMKFTKTSDPQIAKQTYDVQSQLRQKSPVMDLGIVQAALDDLVATIPQAKTADPASFVDNSFAKELESSGFVASLYQ